MPWPPNPLILEINTWTWLNGLSRKYERTVTLANVPAAEYERLVKQGFDAVWLMGAWERSPAGIDVARQHKGIMKELRETLPDFSETDLVGSPYCIRRYRVESLLGGKEGLAIARRELARRGIKLILDFVPNHVAPDHPWTIEYPEYFLRGTEVDLATNPEDFLESNNHIFARARDPFYPPWPDVLQLDIFSPGLRAAMQATILDIAEQCDGVRCDMAMLVTNDIFIKTWKKSFYDKPNEELWELLIPEARKRNPDFKFIAEVYWDMEWEMMQLGFDFCYDKRLYDRLIEGNAGEAREHLSADVNFQGKLLRFLENHDEARAGKLFEAERHKALAVASLTLPGARLIHDGQMEGKKIRVPVFLGRGPIEEPDPEILDFYRRLVKLLGMESRGIEMESRGIEMESRGIEMESRGIEMESLRTGKWSLCNISGWPDNQSCLDMLAWEWISPDCRILIIVNLSNHPSQALIKSVNLWQNNSNYQLEDVISGKIYERDGTELNDKGLYVDLAPWGVHVLAIIPAPAPAPR